MAKAGQLTIDVDAGTAKFIVDLERVNGKLREFGNSAEMAGGHVVSSMQATSGAIRTLEGQSIRAAERFLADTLGIGSAMQAIFPIVGAIATIEVIAHMGQEIGKLTGWWGPVSDAEKKATEEAERLDQKIQNIGRHIQQLNLESFALKMGKLAGAAAGAAQLLARAQAIRDQIAAVEKQGAGTSLGTMALSLISPLVAGGQISAQQKAEGAARAAALKDLHAKLEEIETEAKVAFEKLGVDELDDTMAKNNAITAENNRAAAEARKAFEEKVAWNAGMAELGKKGVADALEGYRKEDELRHFHLEQAKRYEAEQEKLQAAAVKKAEELAKELAKERARAAQATAGGNIRVSEINAKGAGETADLGIQARKLAIERQYGLEIGHTLAAQLSYKSILMQLDRQAAEEKIKGLRAEKAIAFAAALAASGRESGEQLLGKGGAAEAEEAARAMEKVAELTQQINALEQEAANKQYSAQTDIAKTRSANTLGAQLGGAGGQLPTVLSSAMADGIMRGGQGMGKEVRQSLAGIGKEMLGDIFKKSFEELIVAITGNTIATNLNTIVTGIGHLFGFASGGRPAPGVPYLVGENGPEVRVDDGPGSIIPNSMLSRGSFANSARASRAGSAGPQSISFGDLHFHAHDVASPQEHLDMVAQGLPSVLKALSPTFSPFSS